MSTAAAAAAHTWADVEQDSSSRGRRTLKNNIRFGRDTNYGRLVLKGFNPNRSHHRSSSQPQVLDRDPCSPFTLKGKESSLLKEFFGRREDASCSASATHDGRRTSPKASGTATARIPTTTNARVSLQVVVDSHIIYLIKWVLFK